jgi:hypothetical protein
MPAPPRDQPFSTLDLLSQRPDGRGAPWIGPAGRLAAERYARDLAIAGMIPRVTIDWSRGERVDRSRMDVGLNPTEAAIAARGRLNGVHAALGPDLAGLLIDICGFDKGLEAMERERGWPVRSAKVVVRVALGALARHYGYDDAARGRDAVRSVRWSAGPRPPITRPRPSA